MFLVYVYYVYVLVVYKIVFLRMVYVIIVVWDLRENIVRGVSLVWII